MVDVICETKGVFDNAKKKKLKPTEELIFNVDKVLGASDAFNVSVLNRVLVFVTAQEMDTRLEKLSSISNFSQASLNLPL